MNWGVRSLTVRFGARCALRDVAFEAAPGEVRGVVGGDGAGKTTLVRALVGAIGHAQGEVRRPPAREIGYMPAGSGVFQDLSVDENLAFTAAAYGMPRAERDERATQLLERTGLLDARKRLGGELSGGMRQKLGVLLAMLHGPSLLVLDEPTTGVDPLSRADLWRLIAQAASEGAQVVLSTSYLDEAERTSQLLFLQAGRALASGTAADVVRAMPGRVRWAPERPPGDALERSWRRGASWRIWTPPGVSEERKDWEAVSPDLQDAVTVAALAHELQGAHQGGASQ